MLAQSVIVGNKTIDLCDIFSASLLVCFQRRLKPIYLTGPFSQFPELGFYVPFNSLGHIGSGPPHCHLRESNPH